MRSLSLLVAVPPVLSIVSAFTIENSVLRSVSMPEVPFCSKTAINSSLILILLTVWLPAAPPEINDTLIGFTIFAPVTEPSSIIAPFTKPEENRDLSPLAGENVDFNTRCFNTEAVNEPDANTAEMTLELKNPLLIWLVLNGLGICVRDALP